LSRDRFSAYEFALVIGIVFGWPILGSIRDLFEAAPQAAGGDVYGMGHLYGLIVEELICLPAAALILWSRGWRPADFPFGVTRFATVLGIVVAFGTWGVDAILSIAFQFLFPALREMADAVGTYRPNRPPDLIAIYILSIINPVFEEVVVCGYVIPALATRFGLTAAINVSVVIRCSYHLYQGIAAAPFHLAYGLIQAYVFVRYRNLWPLVVSHAILDFVGLLAYA